MKKIAILLILIIFYASNTWAQKIEAQVKEEVELMSVLARLAGYGEYGFDDARRSLHGRHRLRFEKIPFARSRENDEAVQRKSTGWDMTVSCRSPCR